MKLTARQNTLLARLVDLGERAHAGTLPVDVVEVLGFGSFFRGKDRPKDVDLLIRCTREHGRAFAAFRVILEHICSDVQYQYDYPRPLAALLDEYDRRRSGALSEPASCGDERAVFAQWLEPYSWSMLFPKSFAESPAWESPFGIMKRLLRKSLPNLNVIHYLYPGTAPEQIGLRAGFTEIIWSRERPDMRQNIVDALAPERVLANARKELQSFEEQLFRLRATRDVLESSVRERLGMPSRTFSETLLQPLQVSDALLTDEEIRAELGLTRAAPEAIEGQQLLRRVEQLRSEVKELWWHVEAMREIKSLLDWHCEGAAAPDSSPAEFVTARLLAGSTAARQSLLQGLLRNLGLMRV